MLCGHYDLALKGHAPHGMSYSVSDLSGLRAIGCGPTDIAALVDGALPQERLLANAPLDIDRELLTSMYEHALSYW